MLRKEIKQTTSWTTLISMQALLANKQPSSSETWKKAIKITNTEHKSCALRPTPN